MSLGSSSNCPLWMQKALFLADQGFLELKIVLFAFGLR
jgi:hypothetical protein